MMRTFVTCAEVPLVVVVVGVLLADGTPHPPCVLAADDGRVGRARCAESARSSAWGTCSAGMY